MVCYRCAIRQSPATSIKQAHRYRDSYVNPVEIRLHARCAKTRVVAGFSRNRGGEMELRRGASSLCFATELATS
jgi:hypothetical protein